jgi:ABC-type phosphate transport system auxiliary subunit
MKKEKNQKKEVLMTKRRYKEEILDLIESQVELLDEFAELETEIRRLVNEGHRYGIFTDDLRRDIIDISLTKENLYKHLSIITRDEKDYVKRR